jgi:hypothetical protein
MSVVASGNRYGKGAPACVLIFTGKNSKRYTPNPTKRMKDVNDIRHPVVGSNPGYDT